MDVWIVPAPACGFTRPRTSSIRELAGSHPASFCCLCLILLFNFFYCLNK